jgi:uncharacterized protein
MTLLTWIVAICLGLYLIALAALFLMQRRLVYLNDPTEVAPAAIGLENIQTMRLATSDGESLVAWRLMAKPGAPLIIYFHGNGTGLGDRGPVFAALATTGAGVLAIDYRGFGGSSGTPTEAGLLLDAEAAYAKAIDLGYTSRQIIVFGESLGTGVAVALASRHAVAGLVLDSPYSSTVDVAAASYWMFPVRWLMLDTFRSDQRIGLVTAPVLIMHGDHDEVVPIRFGEKLFSLAREPREFILVPGAVHLTMGRPEVMPRFRAWMAARVASPAL